MDCLNDTRYFVDLDGSSTDAEEFSSINVWLLVITNYLFGFQAINEAENTT
jgi:hypothetical protein